MTKRPIDSNALKALKEMKMEMANELNPVTNIFTAGPVGGLMTRKLVEMGEKEIAKKK